MLILKLLFLSGEVSAADIAYKKYEVGAESSMDMTALRIKEMFPKDMADYFSEKFSCIHWAGEEPYDDERGKEIQQGLAGCKKLEKKKSALTKAHRAEKKLLSLFEKIENGIDVYGDGYSDFIWNEPNRPSKALNEYTEALTQSLIFKTNEQINKTKRAKSDLQSFVKTNSHLFSRIDENQDRLHPKTLKEYKKVKTDLSELSIRFGE